MTLFSPNSDTEKQKRISYEIIVKKCSLFTGLNIWSKCLRWLRWPSFLLATTVAFRIKKHADILSQNEMQCDDAIKLMSN